MKKIMFITLLIYFSVTNVFALTTNEVLYDKEGTDITSTEALDELYDKLHICSTEGNATASDILGGKTAYSKGEKVTGTIPTMTTAGTTSDGKAKHVDASQVVYGNYSNDTSNNYLYLGIAKHTYTGENTHVRTSESEVVKVLGITGEKLAKGQTIAGVSGTYTSDANATANNILSGKTAYVNGNKLTGTIGSKGATTYTPSTKNQTITAGQYLSGTQTIKGDANLVASNIKKGTSIFGVTGTYEGDVKVKNYSNVVATVESYYKEFKGSYVNMANETCGANQNNCNSSYSTICLNLGFTPSDIINASLQLSGDGYFRMTKGLDSAGITTYRYSSSLPGIYDKALASVSSLNNMTFDTNPNSENAPISNYEITYNNSKLCYRFNATYFSNVAGSSNNAFATNSTSFKISGTVVYR